jgi:hypothetical protein
MKYSMTGQEKGDILMQVTTQAGLTVYGKPCSVSVLPIKTKKVSFESLDIHYHQYHNWSDHTRDNVLLLFYVQNILPSIHCKKF